MKHTYQGFIKTQIERKPDTQGESLEEQIRKAIAGKQPLDGKDIPIWTPYKDGVLPQFNIRTDKQELAIDACDKFAKSEILKGDSGQVEFDKNGNEINTTQETNEKEK